MMAAPPPKAIGKIQTATGPVTVMGVRGAVDQVKVGDPVYRHDTIETGADGAVGITFIDGTAFSLSNNARMALNEFVCAGTSNSALFSLSKGAFAFIAGKVAKVGGLRIETPFARIRGAAQDGGIGILTLAALAFSTIREIQAASRSDAFLDDGTITHKDSPHGTFEITTRDGKVIVADDPGETVVVDPSGSVTRLPNSSSRMAELQQAQQNALATLSLGLGQQGAAPGGSSTDTQFALQQLLPINFSQAQNNALAPLAVTITTQTNSGVIDFSQQQFKPPPPLPPTIAISTIAGTIAGQISVAADNIINASKANAGVNITGATSHVEDGQIVTVTIVNGSNHVVYSTAATVTNGTWVINVSPTDAKLLADGSYTLNADVSNLAGIHAQASQAIAVDQDVNEHPSVLVNVGSTTPIGAAGAGQVAFTISGLEPDDSGTLTFSDQAGHAVVVTIVNGQAVDSQGHPISTVNLSSLGDGTIASSLAVSDTAGNQFSASGNAVPLDQDLGEHPSVLVNGGSTTPIGAAGAGQVAFTISGLASDDSGTLTFSDQAGHAVVGTIVNGQAVDSQGHQTSTVNLSSLSDGTITSSLAVSDTAGNQFSASGNAVPLDQDLGEHPSVLVNGGSTTPIGAAGAGQVAFTISGLEPDDSGTLTFSDQARHAVVVTIVNGQAVDSQGHPISTVNLSSLSDGTITSSLAVSDTAGNHFSAGGNAVPLDQDLGEHPSVLVNGGSTTPIGAAGAGQVALTISGLEADDSGTLTFSDQAGKTVQVHVTGGQTNYTASLSSLANGSISSSLAVSTDTAGNTFQPVAGNAVTLDQDIGEQLTVNFSGLTGGHAVEDQTITAIVTDTDNDVPTSGITYAWQISHDGGNSWSTVGGNTRTYTPGEDDEGGLLKVLVSFTDAAGNTESGSSTVGVLPLLTIADNSLLVSPNGSVLLGISLTQEPTPDDDPISVTISFPSSGVHDPTIAAGDHATGNPHTSGGITTYTFSVADVNSGLTFTNHGDPVDTLTVKEVLNGNTVATSQTITVTDPPVSGGGAIVSDQPVSATGEDASVQSTPDSALLFKDFAQ